MNSIQLWKVCQNNLKSVDVKIPLGSFTVICGPSGSGKSSLAFETLYAEGQRRYIEGLSNYAKQFLNKAPKPDLEAAENIPPALALEQKNKVKTSRSTVGTTVEILDELRLLYEKVGVASCPDHEITLRREDAVSGAEKAVSCFEGQRGYVLCPIYLDQSAFSGKKLFAHLLKEGFLRIYIPKRSSKKINFEKTWALCSLGKVSYIEELIKQKKFPKKDFYLVIDRIVLQKETKTRLTDALSQAYKFTNSIHKNIFYGKAVVLTTEGQWLWLQERNACSICSYEFEEISSHLFSFNHPKGACPECNGFGNTLIIDPEKVIPNPEWSLAQGAIKPLNMPSSQEVKQRLRVFCKKHKIDWHKPWNKLSLRHKKLIWKGGVGFKGINGYFDYLERKKYKMHVRVLLARYKSSFICKACKGSRLKPEAQKVFFRKKSIVDRTQMTIEDLYEDLKNKITLTKHEKEKVGEVYKQILSRLKFLKDVGLGYLTLSRPTRTLSGGEFQRLNLANQLGMELSQTLYVLDEPTVGLHPRDNRRLIYVLKELQERGNTLVVVEHDQDVIQSSHYVLEMGPGSGLLGGKVVYFGQTKDFLKEKNSLTASYIARSAFIIRRESRPVNLKNHRYKLQLKGAKGHNLKNLNVAFPLNRLVTVTGVSGSGKSSLVIQTLYPALARALKKDFIKGLEYDSLKGFEDLKDVSLMDASPVGKTARSSPVTYLKIYDGIRQIMSSTQEARFKGYGPGYFSLNVQGGRCPQCEGLGFEVIDMMFMDDIEITCDLCRGQKFQKEILDITYKGKNIKDILNMTVEEAMAFFISFPRIWKPLSLMKEVGLEYLKLGQRSNTLSGGESQRLKIAKKLYMTSQKETLFILDEPTTGLHFREVHLLLKVLNKLIDGGSSVLLIEHNLEIISQSDYIIDLGPEAGVKGGSLVQQGMPSDFLKKTKSHTATFLKEYINF